MFNFRDFSWNKVKLFKGSIFELAIEYLVKNKCEKFQTNLPKSFEETEGPPD